MTANGNEMISGNMHMSPGIYLIAEENLGKYQPGDCLMKAVRPVIAIKCGLLPPNEVGRLAQHARKGQERKEGKFVSIRNGTIGIGL